MALALGHVPTVSPFSVTSQPEGSSSQQIVEAGTGPVFSLILGLVLMVVARRWGSGFVRLFWMWLAFMGVQNFVGYLVIAPVASGGDTGRVLALLDAPAWVYVVVGLAGVAGQFLLARRFAFEVKRYAADLDAERRIAFYPWLIGTGVAVVLAAVEVLLISPSPEIVVVVVSYNFAIGVFAPMQFIFSTRARNDYEGLTLSGISRAGLAVTIAASAAMIILAGVGGVMI